MKNGSSVAHLALIGMLTLCDRNNYYRTCRILIPTDSELNSPLIQIGFNPCFQILKCSFHVGIAGFALINSSACMPGQRRKSPHAAQFRSSQFSSQRMNGGILLFKGFRLRHQCFLYTLITIKPPLISSGLISLNVNFTNICCAFDLGFITFAHYRSYFEASLCYFAIFPHRFPRFAGFSQQILHHL